MLYPPIANLLEQVDGRQTMPYRPSMSLTESGTAPSGRCRFCLFQL